MVSSGQDREQGSDVRDLRIDLPVAVQVLDGPTQLPEDRLRSRRVVDTTRCMRVIDHSLRRGKHTALFERSVRSPTTEVRVHLAVTDDHDRVVGW